MLAPPPPLARLSHIAALDQCHKGSHLNEAAALRLSAWASFAANGALTGAGEDARSGMRLKSHGDVALRSSWAAGISRDRSGPANACSSLGQGVPTGLLGERPQLRQRLLTSLVLLRERFRHLAALRQSRKHSSMEHREARRDRFTDHLPDTGVPPPVHGVAPLERTRNRLKPTAFGGAEYSILPRVQGSVASYMSARGRDGRGRPVWIHPSIAGVSESSDQPPRAIRVSHRRSEQWVVAGPTRGLVGVDALDAASLAAVRFPGAGAASRWYGGHHFVSPVGPNGNSVHRMPSRVRRLGGSCIERGQTRFPQGDIDRYELRRIRTAVSRSRKRCAPSPPKDAKSIGVLPHQGKKRSQPMLRNPELA